MEVADILWDTVYNIHLGWRNDLMILSLGLITLALGIFSAILLLSISPERIDTFWQDISYFVHLYKIKKFPPTRCEQNYGAE